MLQNFRNGGTLEDFDVGKVFDQTKASLNLCFFLTDRKKYYFI